MEPILMSALMEISRLDPLTHHVVVCRLAVQCGAEASQPLLEHEDAERVTGRHQHVNPQVKLVAVYDERLGNKNRDIQHGAVCCCCCVHAVCVSPTLEM